MLSFLSFEGSETWKAYFTSKSIQKGRLLYFIWIRTHVPLLFYLIVLKGS